MMFFVRKVSVSADVCNSRKSVIDREMSVLEMSVIERYQY